MSIVEQFWRWCKRDPGSPAANIAAALLITFWRWFRRLRPSSTATRPGRLDQATALGSGPVALGRRGRSDAASLDARWRAVDAYTAQARAGRFSGRPGQRFESLEAVSQATKLLDGLPQGSAAAARRDSLRDLAITCMTLADLKPAGRVINRPTDTIATALDSRP